MSLLCPSCAEPMREVRDAELVYDHCACGALWFDRAGLEEYGRRYEARALAPEAMIVPSSWSRPVP